MSAELGEEAIADCEKAISYGGDYVRDVSRWQQFLSNQYRSIGEYRKSIALENQIRQKFEEIEKGKGRSFGINLRIAQAYLAMGDLRQAEVYVKRNQALLAESKGWNNRDAAQAWEASVANGAARLFEELAGERPEDPVPGLLAAELRGILST